MLLHFLLLFTGFFLLYFGAEILVKGSSNLALRYGIKKVIIASTLIAVGTSAPEFFITFISSFERTGDIGIGNIVGSNISNILLVLGLSIILGKITINPQLNRLDIPIMLFETVLLVPILKDLKVTRFEGGILLIPFIFYIISLFYIRKENGNLEKNSITTSSIKIALLVIGGILLLYIGAKISVKSGVQIAKYFGISPLVIGLSLIAVGSSLPELFTSIVASFKKEPDISFGNVVGSNIFNIGFAIGITGVIRPFSFESKNVSFNLNLLILTSILLATISFLSRKNKIPKIIGYIFTTSFFLYIIYLYKFLGG